jgi:hypothetical protein
MRLAVLTLIAALSLAPAHAQQLSPLTGTTATPPGATPVPPGSLPPGSVARPGTMGQQRTTMARRFEAANTTHDGKLTLDQARNGHMPQVARNFGTIDSTHRGYVTLDDIRAAARARREARRAARLAQPAQSAQ